MIPHILTVEVKHAWESSWQKGYRDKVKIATKLPHYYIKAEGDMERYFKEQLERLQTDHVEYYLMHMLNDIAAWERLTALGIQDWIAEKKEKRSDWKYRIFFPWRSHPV